ncbi:MULTISPECIES: nucleoside-diphosphate sugar epimerase/dehydratase [unclassified Lentimicrobium]|uniref:polysaccharide biosynthesis protein n=1 Tax=unclassified Lentimicrobium TaxID=2677434 RepID=UPI00155477EF|nr:MULTISPECIES: nucleoside-diphosphate sugar epimerase/dehydratase [unclassified Lentimicrobium]NPD44702.1 polysaccharide biosynthesis protein [Lentimicrobium sp. S6]NPD83442.1 polysaccharide biosynthesis protein [Lentimicrobium sp. L6]
MKDWILKYKVPRWTVFIIDTLIIVFSILTAYMLRFNFRIPGSEIAYFNMAFVIIFTVRVFSFFVAKMHAGVIQYTSTRDASRIFIILSSGSILFAIANMISVRSSLQIHLIPYSIIILEFITSLLFLVSYRVFVKIAYIELSKPHSGFTKVMIFGAGEAGVITSRALEAEINSKVKIIGFFDDDKSKAKKRLGGTKVYSGDDIRKILEEKNIEQLILAVQSLPNNRKQELIDICMELNVVVLNVPPVQTWINGELSLKQIRSVRIEDLLGRDEIKLSEAKVKGDLRDKVVLISGAAGSIGSELVRQVSRFKPKKLLLVDQAESPLFQLEIEQSATFPNVEARYILADVANTDRMKAVFARFKPHYVFHAAAYKHVPMMEKNPMEAIRVNVLGTRNMANLSVEHKVSKFVMISTDKAVNPTNVMGASKRFAEVYVRSLASSSKTQFITTRFGNVLGSNGSVIPLFEKQIANGGPVTVTHKDITRFFMTIPEACRLVLEAGSMGKGGEIFVFDMGKSVRIVDLAKKMIRLSGLELNKDIAIEFTGLRPGEKLYEELLAEEENTKPTHHEKILIANVQESQIEEINNTVMAFQEALAQQDVFELVKLLKKMIPEYKSENSEFSVLD